MEAQKSKHTKLEVLSLVFALASVVFLGISPFWFNYASIFGALAFSMAGLVTSSYAKEHGKTPVTRLATLLASLPIVVAVGILVFFVLYGMSAGR